MDNIDRRLEEIQSKIESIQRMLDSHGPPIGTARMQHAAKLKRKERALLKSYDVHCLYSLQHIRNLRSIQRRGILCRNRIQSIGLNVVDLSDSSVQVGRRQVRIAGRPLHDYVPLFFRPLTPMQYVVCVHEGRRDEVAVIQVSLEVFALPGTVFTDGNARASDTKVYKDLADVSELDWDILDTPDAWSREYKRKKSAEVLVVDSVAPGYLERVCVTNACRLPRGLSLPCERDESVFP